MNKEGKSWNISKTNIIDVNADTFMTEVIEASKEKPIIVDFWAPWCEPCKQLTPLLEKLVSMSGGRLRLAKLLERLAAADRRASPLLWRPSTK